MAANTSAFDALLTQFLFSPSGAKFMRDFYFDGELECGKPAPPIKV